MTEWKRQPPRSVVALENAPAIAESSAARSLITGYQTMLAEANGSLPHRQSLDLSLFVDAVPHIALCAISKPDKCTYRIAGEALRNRIGFNPAGVNYYDLVPAARRHAAQRAMNMVVDQKCGFLALIEQTYSQGPNRLVEAVALPIEGQVADADGYILFSDQELNAKDRRDSKDFLLGANIVHRDLIDIGFGIDERFEDLV